MRAPVVIASIVVLSLTLALIFALFKTEDQKDRQILETEIPNRLRQNQEAKALSTSTKKTLKTHAAELINPAVSDREKWFAFSESFMKKESAAAEWTQEFRALSIEEPEERRSLIYLALNGNARLEVTEKLVAELLEYAASPLDANMELGQPKPGDSDYPAVENEKTLHVIHSTSAVLPTRAQREEGLKGLAAFAAIRLMEKNLNQYEHELLPILENCDPLIICTQVVALASREFPQWLHKIKSSIQFQSDEAQMRFEEVLNRYAPTL